MSGVTCHVSCVTCLVSPVTWYMSHVTCHFFSFFSFLEIVVKLVSAVEGLLSTGPTLSSFLKSPGEDGTVLQTAL